MVAYLVYCFRHYGTSEFFPLDRNMNQTPSFGCSLFRVCLF